MSNSAISIPTSNTSKSERIIASLTLRLKVLPDFSPNLSRQLTGTRKRVCPRLQIDSTSVRLAMLPLDLLSWLTQPPWWLQFLYYALLTTLFTGILAPIMLERYRENRRRKGSGRSRKAEEAKANVERLTSKIQAIRYHLINQIDDDIRRVGELKFFDETPSRESDILNTAREFPDSSAVATRYVETIREAVDWRDVNRQLYKAVIRDLVTNNFHNTLADHPHRTPNGWAGSNTLDVAFQILLIDPIVKGDTISLELLGQLSPPLYIQIRQLSAEGEGIERFLKDLNSKIARDQFLRRLRRKQEDIKVLGNELKKSAEVHLSNLQENLGSQQNYIANVESSE